MIFRGRHGRLDNGLPARQSPQGCISGNSLYACCRAVKLQSLSEDQEQEGETWSLLLRLPWKWTEFRELPSYLPAPTVLTAPQGRRARSWMDRQPCGRGNEDLIHWNTCEPTIHTRSSANSEGFS